MNFKKNKIAYYLQSVDVLGMSIPPVYLLWQLAGLTLGDILFLQGIFSLFLLVLEYPSGIVADRFGRRNTVAFGILFTAFGLMGYAVAKTFLQFVVVELLFAIGLASVSGANTAFIWDSAVDSGNEESAAHIINTGVMVRTGSNIVLLLLGSLLMLVDPFLPLYVGMVYLFFAASAMAVSEEPKKHRILSGGMILRESLVYVKTRRFIEVLLLSSLLFIPLRVAFWAYIPKLQANDVDPAFFSLVLMMANVIVFLMSWMVRRGRVYGGKILGIAMASVLAGIALFVLPLDLFGVLLAIGLHQIGRGAISIISVVQLNEGLDSEVRASVQSLKSMLLSIGYFMFASAANLVESWILFLNFLLTCVILLLYLPIAKLGQGDPTAVPLPA